MSFLKKLWKNRESQYPSRRTMTRVDTGASMTYDVERAEGVVTQVGDDFSAESMNDLEDRIEDAFDNVTFDVDSSLSTTSENPVQNKVITTNLNTASTNATNALDMIRSTSLFPTGDAYSTSRSYSVGNLVIYNNALYRCKTACSAGSWSANRSNFESITLASAITDLNPSSNDLGVSEIRAGTCTSTWAAAGWSTNSVSFSTPMSGTPSAVILTLKNTQASNENFYVNSMSKNGFGFCSYQAAPSINYNFYYIAVR